MNDGEQFVRDLYDRCGPLLRFHALHWSYSDPDRAEELIQETVVRAWLHQQAAPGWLVTVMHRLAIDHNRRRAARQDRDSRWGARQQHGPDPADLVLGRAGAADILAALGPDQRAAVAALILLDMTPAEAGAWLGIPAGTVKSRAHRGLARLRRLHAGLAA